MNQWVGIVYKGFKFLITGAPSDKTIKSYIKKLKKYNVEKVLRVCEQSYNTAPLIDAGIQLYDLSIEDGMFPKKEVLNAFFNIVRKQYQENPEACLAIHCVAGLGRAPLLVAIALMELGHPFQDSVELIRRKIRGAINSRQLHSLSKYKPKSRLKEDVKFPCIIQ